MNRRRLLTLLLAAASLLPFTRLVPGSTPRPGHELLEQLFADPGHARLLGRSYLASTRGDSTPAAERADLALMLRRFRPETAVELRNVLHTRIRDDFAEGRVVVVQGWYLARTEAALCSLLVT